MNSSSDNRLSLSVLINRRLFPVLTTSTVAVFLAGYILEYIALARFVTPDKSQLVRHAYHTIGLIPAIGSGILIAIIALTIWIVDNCALRKIKRIAKKAKVRYQCGSTDPISVPSRIEEIADLGFVFDRLFSEQLKRVSELIELSCAMRHNASNLLTQIRNDADAIIEDNELGECLGRRIVTDVDRLMSILTCNLSMMENYNRISEAPSRDVDLTELVDTCVEAHASLAIEKDIALSAIKPAHAVIFCGHEQKLMNLLHNLIDNAIKYTPCGGSVTVSLRVNNNTITISVTDNGIGIAKENISRIFKRGIRLASQIQAPGNGYGLSFVDSVVAFYRGTITCVSTEGKGSTFTVSIPIDYKKGISA